MGYTMRAALMTGIGKPLAVREIEATALEYGQVFVNIIASGICGAQLQEIDGRKESGPLPHPLGHEGVGIVEFVGPAVTKVKAGDKVVLHWRKGDGIESDFPAYRYKGGRITGGKVTTLMESAIVSENRVTPVPHDTPDELCALLGCGLSTALGTIETEANVKFGESVLIIGCGGLGLNLILAAKMAQAGRIYAVDIRSEKESAVKALGAEFGTFLTGIRGDIDVMIDTSGHSETISIALRMLGPSGRFILVGQPDGNIILQEAKHLFEGDGKTIKATQGGGFRPSLDIPRYVNLWRAGLLNLDGIVSHRVPLENINHGFNLVRNGKAVRVLVTME